MRRQAHRVRAWPVCVPIQLRHIKDEEVLLPNCRRDDLKKIRSPGWSNSVVCPRRKLNAAARIASRWRSPPEPQSTNPSPAKFPLTTRFSCASSLPAKRTIPARQVKERSLGLVFIGCVEGLAQTIAVRVISPWATNWTAAQDLAVSWGGHLATIASQKEQDFINEKFLAGSFDHRPLWIGLVRATGVTGGLREAMVYAGWTKQGTQFEWVTSERFSYSNWKPGEPNDTPPGENRVAINWEYSDWPSREPKATGMTRRKTARRVTAAPRMVLTSVWWNGMRWRTKGRFEASMF